MTPGFVCHEANRPSIRVVKLAILADTTTGEIFGRLRCGGSGGVVGTPNTPVSDDLRVRPALVGVQSLRRPLQTHGPWPKTY